MGKGNGTSRASSSSAPRGLTETRGPASVTGAASYEHMDRKGMTDFLQRVVDWGFPVREVLNPSTFEPTFDGGVKKTKTGYIGSITLNIGNSEADQFQTVKGAEDKVLSVLNTHKDDLDRMGISYKMSYREPAFDSKKLTISFAQKHIPGYKKSSKWTD